MDSSKQPKIVVHGTWSIIDRMSGMGAGTGVVDPMISALTGVLVCDRLVLFCTRLCTPDLPAKVIVLI